MNFVFLICGILRDANVGAAAAAARVIHMIEQQFRGEVVVRRGIASRSGQWIPLLRFERSSVAECR